MKLLIGLAVGGLVYLALVVLGIRYGWRWAGGFNSFWARVAIRSFICAALTAPSFLMGGERGFPVPAWLGLIVSLVTMDKFTLLPALQWIGSFWGGFFVLVAAFSYFTGR